MESWFLNFCALLIHCIFGNAINVQVLGQKKSFISSFLVFFFQLFLFFKILYVSYMLSRWKKTLIKQGNPSDLGRFHLSLTDGLSIKCVIKKLFCFSFQYNENWWSCSYLCVLTLHYVSLNLNEKQKSF